jgi:hypothetical protein
MYAYIHPKEKKLYFTISIKRNKQIINKERKKNLATR